MKCSGFDLPKRLTLVLRVLVACAATFGASACAPEGAWSEDGVGTTESPTIYGQDGRLDVLDHPDASLRKLAQTSTATMIASSAVNTSDPNNVTYTSQPLGTKHGLCSSERFLTDPAAGSCSGTLIGDDLLLTAGHCFGPLGLPCSSQTWVFNFSKGTSGAVRTITSEDVFTCSQVLVQRNDQVLDYAIIRLDRYATPRFTPAPVRAQRSPLDAAQRVSVIGSPLGIPLKIDSSGSVRTPGAAGASEFRATTDTFRGNSGSGVYENDSYQLAGVLVAGDADFAQENGCQVMKRCAEDACSGERVTYAWQAIEALCAVTSGLEVCAHRQTMPYFAISTNNAVQNSKKRLMFLSPGQTIDFGTCGVPGSTGQFNTFLRLISAAGTLVASNDNASGCGQLSRAQYTVPALQGGLYELSAGCNGVTACEGTVAYTTSGSTGGSFTYDASNTASATTGTRNVTVTVRAGETLIAGTCGVEQAFTRDDTYLRLFAGTLELTSSDDIGGDCGFGSRLSYKPTTTNTFSIRAGCYGSATCSATVSYVIVPGGSYSYSAGNTGSATQNTANNFVRLEAGDFITVGTCSLPGATATGDTYLRLFNGSSQVAENDDSCGFASLLTFTATSAGTYEIRSGCYGVGQCSGTTAYKIRRKGSGSGSVSYNVSNTATTTQNYRREALFLREGQLLTAGTCGVTGSAGTGDTFLRLFGPDGSEVVSNDDSNCGGSLSKLSYFVPANGEGSYELRGGCSGNTACTGTVAYSE